jgi:hypothetical protein
LEQRKKGETLFKFCTVHVEMTFRFIINLMRNVASLNSEYDNRVRQAVGLEVLSNPIAGVASGQFGDIGQLETWNPELNCKGTV